MRLTPREFFVAGGAIFLSEAKRLSSLEPQPLALGLAQRLGRLEALGNAIVRTQLLGCPHEVPGLSYFCLLTWGHARGDPRKDFAIGRPCRKPEEDAFAEPLADRLRKSFQFRRDRRFERSPFEAWPTILLRRFSQLLERLSRRRRKTGDLDR